MFNKKLEAKIEKLKEDLKLVQEIVGPQTPRVKIAYPGMLQYYNYQYEHCSLGEIVIRQAKEIDKLKAIVAELCDYVYSENNKGAP